MVAADWQGNRTYAMEFDWTRGSVGEKVELADVEWPTNIEMTSASECCAIKLKFCRVFFWEIAVKIPSQKTHLGNLTG